MHRISTEPFDIVRTSVPYQKIRIQLLPAIQYKEPKAVTGGTSVWKGRPTHRSKVLGSSADVCRLYLALSKDTQ